MRFFKTIACGTLFPSCVCARYVQNFQNLLKRNIYNDVSSECANEMNQFSSEFYSCISVFFEDINEVNEIEIFCKNTYKSEKCQKIFKDPMLLLPSCNKDPLFKKNTDLSELNSFKAELDMLCQTDENGKICPFINNSESSNSDRKQRNEQNLQALINEYCKSKLCTDSFISYYSQVAAKMEERIYKANTSTSEPLIGESYYREYDSVKNALETLNSNQCKAKHAPSSVASKLDSIGENNTKNGTNEAFGNSNASKDASSNEAFGNNNILKDASSNAVATEISASLFITMAMILSFLY